jgi:excisionase family DNA binding protein
LLFRFHRAAPIPRRSCPSQLRLFFALARPKTQELPMQAFDEIERFFSIAETCRILGCQRSTVYSRIKEGRLKAVRIDGSKRIPRSEDHQCCPAGGGMNAEASIVYILSRQRPMPLRLLAANVAAEHHSAQAVKDALQRLQGLGPVVTDADGRLSLDRATAAEISRNAALEERRAYESPVDRPVFQ